MKEVIEKIRRELTENGSEAVQKSCQRFFKEPIRCYGIKSAVVDRIAKDNFKLVNGNSKSGIFQLCDALWESGYMEESMIACNWSRFVHKLYEPADFKLFESWIEEHVDNWAVCDTFCNHTVGEFIEMFPEFIAELIRWTQSENRWLRRASAVSLIVPARKGKFLHEIIEIAGLLLSDQDDMVQKGYGWMLKVAGQRHQEVIFDFVLSRKAVMPRTALRYAIEKMSGELKARAMEK